MCRSVTASDEATAGPSGSGPATGQQRRRSFVPDHVKNPGTVSGSISALNLSGVCQCSLWHGRLGRFSVLLHPSC